MDTRLGYNEIQTRNGIVRIELRPRKGAFGLFCQNRWLRIREPNPDDPKDDPCKVHKKLAWELLGSLDYVNKDAIQHHFDVEWKRGGAKWRTKSLAAAMTHDLPALNGA